MSGVLALGNVDHGESNEERPFLYISQSEPVRCIKCGREVPAPGRIAIKMDGEARYYCDCITEYEMYAVVEEWNNFMVLNSMEDAPEGGGN